MSEELRSVLPSIAILGVAAALGIACAVNGVAHPLLAVRSGGYFPGLVTSPGVGIAGRLLLRCMFRVTGPRSGR